MPDRGRLPLIFLAFANDRQDGARYLRNLPEELRRLREHLGRAEAHGLCEIVIRTNATVGEVLDVFQDPQHRDRIAIFHFGGHAGDYQLLLESAEGAPALAHAEGLAAFLGQQRGLQLVFLNGCSTQPQVEGLQRAGIPAVIATSEAIEDGAATELSARFYAGLSSGASLQAAYDEAVAAVRTQRGGGDRSTQVRDMVQHEAAEISGRWPWELYLRDGAEIVGAWSLPEAAGDPLFGLPPLPERDLPETPYRHLKWFREDDAEVFFGRGREVRDLYERVTASATSPILLFYGQSGVGKSSLLAAGLLPRLEATHTVRYARRERERGLAGTLADALETDDVPAAWHAAEEAAGQPLVVILDQAEELYTRPGDGGEMAAFLEVLTDLFADRERRPRGTLVLAFRKEWLADLEARLSEARLPRTKFFLERLGRDGIAEVVNGPARSERLRQQYRLTVEDRLAELIADDLLEDRDAPVAPTLEILLTKMWDRATAHNPDAPAFTVDLYHQLKRDGLLLDDFLEEQLDGLRQWNADAVDSGLTLDVLTYHTTPLGTAERRTRAEVEAAYGHQRDVLPDLVQQSKDHYLLTAVPTGPEDEPATRLAHDTLAPLVRERHKESDKPGQRAERILESRAVDWQDGQTGAPLDRVDLATVEEGQQGMRDWSEAEQRLIAASRAERDRQDQSRRRQRASAIAGVAFIALLGVMAVVLWRQAVASEETALRRAYISTAQTLASIAPKQQGRDEKGSHRKWLLLARQAYVFNEKYEGPMFETIDSVVREALRSGVLSNILPGHDSQVESLAFSADGVWLASGSFDGAVRVWRLDDLAAAPTVVTGSEGRVTSMAFSADGVWLASGSFDGMVRLWPLSDLASAPTVLTADDEGGTSVAFSPDGQRLASGSFDGAVRVWRLDDLAAAPTVLTGHDDEVTSVAFGPGGALLASGSLDGTVHLWRLDDLEPDPTVLLAADDEDEVVTSVAFSPDGAWLASGSADINFDNDRPDSIDGTVRLWRLDDLASAPTVLTGHDDGVTSVAFSPDGIWLASGSAGLNFDVSNESYSQDGTVRLWHLGDLAAAPIVLTGHDNVVTSVAFSPDGARLASGSHDGSVRMWWLDGLATTPNFIDRYRRGFTSVAFSPDSAWLASAGFDSTMHLWRLGDLESGPAESLINPDGRVESLAFSADGVWLASGSFDGPVRVWRLDDLASAPAVLTGSEGRFASLAFSPDGERLASGSFDGAVRVWRLDDLASGPTVLTADDEGGISVAFSPDGERLASGSFDGVVRVWRLDDPAAAPTVLTGHDNRVVSLAFSPDGAWLASASGGTDVSLGVDGVVHVWRLDDLAAAPSVLTGDESGFTSVAFSPDGEWLASGSVDIDFDVDGVVRVWRLDDLTAAPIVVTGHDNWVTSVDFSADGEWLASAGVDGTVRLWKTVHGLADAICDRVDRNLTREEWNQFIGEELPYECTCPNLPPHPSTDLAACPG